VQIDGQAPANSQRAVSITSPFGVIHGISQADGNGKWKIQATLTSDGAYTVTAKETDGSGNASDASSPLIFTLDTTAPATPPPPTFTVVADKVMLQGSAEKNSKVTVFDGTV
jgi:hypothetical protein